MGQTYAHHFTVITIYPVIFAVLHFRCNLCVIADGQGLPASGIGIIGLICKIMKRHDPVGQIMVGISINPVDDMDRKIIPHLGFTIMGQFQPGIFRPCPGMVIYLNGKTITGMKIFPVHFYAPERGEVSGFIRFYLDGNILSQICPAIIGFPSVCFIGQFFKAIQFNSLGIHIGSREFP